MIVAGKYSIVELGSGFAVRKSGVLVITNLTRAAAINYVLMGRTYE
jgi:hypothetical protein